MAHDVIYKHPSDEVLYSVDFTDDLPDDTTVTSSSAVTAVDSAGASASAVVGTVSQSGMLVKAVLQAGTNLEDYTITVSGRGGTTSRDSTKVVEMRVRSSLQGNI